MPIGGARRAKIEITADSSRLGRGLNQARSKLGSFGRSAGRGIGGGIAGGIVKGAGILGAVNAVTDMFTSGADDAMQFEREITRLAIAQGKTNEQMDETTRELTEISKATGVARNEILAGAAAYQALTGDTEGAVAATRAFARVSLATGAAVTDVAAAAQGLRDNLGIAANDFEAMFSILLTQGKAGSVELKDFANEVASLSAAWKQFEGGTGVAGATELGAAFQTVRKDVGSSSEAATRLQALTVSLVRNAKKLGKAGIQVFDAKGERRNFTAIVEDFRKRALSDVQLVELLGSSEALQALRAMTGHWTDFQSLVQNTDVGAVARDGEQFASSAAGRLQTSMNNLKLAVAEAFTPERIAAFAKAVDGAARGVGWVIDRIEELERTIDMLTGGDQHVVSDTMIARSGASGVRRSTGGILDVDTHLGRNYSIGTAANVEGIRAADAQARQAAAAPGAAGRVNMDLQRLIAELTRLKVLVQVDGNTVATANANAGKRRTRPGG